MTKQYTNELTSELLAELNKPSHTPEQMSALPEEAQQIIVKHMEDDRLHPVNTIYRFAVEGSLTRDGGIIQTGTTEMIILDENCKERRIARTQDVVVYPDGSTAIIISGAGKEACDNEGQSYALVGSHLSNGDEIISTPQHSTLLAIREWYQLPDDFLVKALTNGN